MSLLTEPEQQFQPEKALHLKKMRNDFSKNQVKLRARPIFQHGWLIRSSDHNILPFVRLG